MKKHIDSLISDAKQLNEQAAEYFANYLQELVYTEPNVGKIDFAMGSFLIYDNDGNCLPSHLDIYRTVSFKLAEIENIFGTITIEATEKKYRDYNSLKNQEIKQKFVDREIYANVGTMVEFILNCKTNGAPFTLDDIENFWQYPEYSHRDTGECFSGGTEEDLEAEKERVNDIISELEDNDPDDPKIDQYNDYLEELDRLETEPAEIFEWYQVSGWLCEKLKANRQCVIPGLNIWGRQTTGQAILLDAVICRICEDLGILEGMENSWK